MCGPHKLLITTGGKIIQSEQPDKKFINIALK